MGTNTNTKASKHQGGFSCHLAPVLDEDVDEVEQFASPMDVAVFLYGATFTTAGLITSDGTWIGIPLFG